MKIKSLIRVIRGKNLCFTRECFKAFRKYYQKDAPLLDQKLKNITQEWIANKLKVEILEKIKETITKHFSPQEIV